MLFKRHVNIKNDKLQKLLIWQSDPFGGHNDNKKAYRSKMTVHGICFYVAWLLVLVFSCAFLIWGPETSIEPIEFDGFLICSTLNKAIVLVLGMTYFFFAFAFYVLNIVHCSDVKSSKFLSFFWWFVIVILWLASIAAVVELIKLWFFS